MAVRMGLLLKVSSYMSTTSTSEYAWGWACIRGM